MIPVLLSLLIQCLFEVVVIGSSSPKDSLEINLPQGKLRGSYDINKTQRMFLGIPFASVEKRYQAPGKPPSWNGTFKANRGSIMCKQYNEMWKTVEGQEDCLVLNVFTPTFIAEEPLPVMVFVHGGGFYKGSNTNSLYNPKYLVMEKVIVVTINYRLGAFGFLCLGNKKAPGNIGLKDQVAALKWIQDNIIYFGGNSNSVTLFGVSSGSAAITYLMFSHAAAGLFHRVILESGTFLSPRFFTYTPIENASKTALRLGYNTSDPDELFKIFMNNTADNIVKASYIDPSANDPFAPYVFGPCVETEDECERSLVIKKPEDMLEENSLNVSIIIGLNNKEGITWATNYNPVTQEKIKRYQNSRVPTDLLFKNKAEKESLINDIEFLYFRNGSTLNNLIDYFTDTTMRYPLTVVSEAFCKKPNRSVYNYFFTYDSIRNLHKLMSNLYYVPGADHADEVFYLFDPVILNTLPVTSRERAMITNMVNLWTSFAKTGVPTTANINLHSCDGELRFIEIGDNIKMITLPHEDRIEFWRETYNKFGRK